MNHVYLVGFMGAGKSAVGRLVADRLGMPFVDTDELIESTAGRTVASIFAEEGEAAFRALEHEALERVSETGASIVACGGGIVVSDENRSLLRRTGTVVYLEVTAAEALARVGDTATRPLLAGPSASVAATSLLAARTALYRAVADLVVDTCGRTVEEVASEVVSAFEDEAER